MSNRFVDLQLGFSRQKLNTSSTIKEYISLNNVQKGDLVNYYNGKVYSIKNLLIEALSNSIQIDEGFVVIDAIKFRSNKVILACINNSRGYLIMITINDNNIIKGEPCRFSFEDVSGINMVKLSDDKILLAYKKDNNAVTQVIKIQGSTISPSSTYNVASSVTDDISIAVLSRLKFLIIWKQSSSNIPYAEVCTTSEGGVINTDYQHNFKISDEKLSDMKLKRINNSETLLLSKEYNRGTMYLATISNSSAISSPIFTLDEHIYYLNVEKVGENKFAIVCRDGSNFNKGTIVIIDTNNTSITVGDTYTFTNSSINDITTTRLSESKIAIYYNDPSNSNKGTIIVARFKNNKISVGHPIVVLNEGCSQNTIVSLSENKVLLIYRDSNAKFNAKIIKGIFNSAAGIAIKDSQSGSSVDVLLEGEYKGFTQTQLGEISRDVLGNNVARYISEDTIKVSPIWHRI